MKKFIIILFTTFLIGFIPNFIFGSSVDGLVLPKLYPPQAVFPIVWSIIYLLLTISLYITSKYDKSLYKIYYFHVIVSSLWTVIFFGLKFRLFAAFWILFILLTLFYLIKRIIRYNKNTLYMQLLYIAWLLFAFYLNVGIYLLNKWFKF